MQLICISETACLAHGTSIGYSSPLTLTDQVGNWFNYATKINSERQSSEGKKHIYERKYLATFNLVFLCAVVKCCTLHTHLSIGFCNSQQSFHFLVWGHLYSLHQNTEELQWLEHWWLIYHSCFELVLESQGKKSQSCRFWIILDDFLFYIEMVYCVYTLESPRWRDSNENTQHAFMLRKIENIFLLCLLA